MKLVHWPLMDGLLHLVQRGEDRAGRGLPRPLLAVRNVTAHPSTASVPITILLYSGPLLCGFNVPIKGLIDPLISILSAWGCNVSTRRPADKAELYTFSSRVLPLLY